MTSSTWLLVGYGELLGPRCAAHRHSPSGGGGGKETARCPFGHRLSLLVVKAREGRTHKKKVSAYLLQTCHLPRADTHSSSSLGGYVRAAMQTQRVRTTEQYAGAVAEHKPGPSHQARRYQASEKRHRESDTTACVTRQAHTYTCSALPPAFHLSVRRVT